MKKLLILTSLLFVSNIVFANCNDPARPGVDWSGCNIEASQLRNTNLTGADLSNATIVSDFLADVRNVNLTNANLSGANISIFQVYNSNFRGANLSNAVFSSNGIYQVNFSNADLSGATFTGEPFFGTSYGTILNSTFKNAKLNNMSFNNWYLPSDNFTGASGASQGNTFIANDSFYNSYSVSGVLCNNPSYLVFPISCQ